MPDGGQELEPFDENKDLDSYDKEKRAFFEELEKMRPDLMFPEAWSDAEKAKAADVVRPTRVKTGMLSSIPMRCRGQECVVAESCPLLAEGINPRGNPCPIEQAFVLQLFNDYVEELSVDVSRMVEVSLVRDLVDQEVQHMRKTWILSQEHFIQENVAGLDADGNVVTAKELHKAVEYEDKILKRKEKIRNALLATREAKVKAGQAQADGAQVVADILEQVREIDRARDKALRAKLGLAEYDEYIEESEIEDAEIIEDNNEED